MTAAGLLVTTAAVLPAAAAPPSAVRDASADSGRQVPAYRASSDPRRVVRVFSVTFWARAGERRYVAAQVIARQSRSTSDSLLMASASIICSPDNGKVVRASATENLRRGTSATFKPRFVYVVPRTGMVECVLLASGLRPRPSSHGYRSSNVWSVAAGSSLSVSEPMSSWARSVETDARSRVLDGQERWTPIATVARVHARRSFELTSDHKVTTCSAVGGSRDSTTIGRELCSSRVSTQGTVVRLTVSAVQLDARGSPCARTQVFSQLRRVTAAVHHAMVFSKSVVRVSRARSCRPAFAIRGSLEHVRGADVVVHAPSELTSIVSD
ncbi:hypothetical protein [Nocardioides conyzicola]|uniref:hypothetical protein n=1 Tax=Nocardioides conyzicola TaxID=1651781 RepID=UPI0031EF9E35